MVATFIIDWPILAFLGFAFGALAPLERWWRSRAFVAGSIAAVVFSSTAFITYAIAPDWMWMYYADPNQLSWIVPLLAVAYLACFGLSFIAAIGLRSSGVKSVWPLAAVSLVLEVIVVAATWDRYHHVGTRLEWLRGSAAELFSTSPEGPVKTLGVLGPLFLVTLVVAIVIAYRGRDAAAARR
ncbi:MAG TPA: hypothetical protein VFK89_01380 [Actinomycetota bacterium]|nr:hypothetical protein [Actinomycetota bacterium]